MYFKCASVVGRKSSLKRQDRHYILAFSRGHQIKKLIRMHSNKIISFHSLLFLFFQLFANF
uniref:Uncharacterized protein n=1 Tax=Meloidogyne enterolobii TaxID=390850 RepID=A0A6V7VVU4_MELEN|nr:unnamed protein product [Meloidogyne enterolobii]